MVPTSQKKDALSRSHVPFPIIIEILSLQKKKEKPEKAGHTGFETMTCKDDEPKKISFTIVCF